LAGWVNKESHMRRIHHILLGRVEAPQRNTQIVNKNPEVGGGGIFIQVKNK